VIFKRRDKPMRRLEDEKQAREAQNKIEEEETTKETIKTTIKTSEETTIEKEKKENQHKILNHKRIRREKKRRLNNRDIK
jgi:hypothetical protein